MNSMRIVLFVGSIFFSSACYAIESEQFRKSALRAQSVFSAVGIEYELKIDGANKGPLETYPIIVFANNASVQLIHGVQSAALEKGLIPLDLDSVSSVGPAAVVYLAKLKPKPEFATYNFKTPVVGKYTYFKSHDEKSFFRTTFTPILVNLSRFKVSQNTSALSDVFDPNQAWIPMPQITARTFSVVLQNTEFKTNQGKTVPFKRLLVFTFNADDSSLPSEAWITAEWTIDGVPYLIPRTESLHTWSFDNWTRSSIGIDYPFHQLETRYKTDIALLDILDESTGWLGKISSGKAKFDPQLTSRREIKIKNWIPIPPSQDLFLKPVDGVAVRDSDTNELYVTGVDKAESDRILGIKDTVDLTPRNSQVGRYLAIAAGAILAIGIGLRVFRRK